MIHVSNAAGRQERSAWRQTGGSAVARRSGQGVTPAAASTPEVRRGSPMPGFAFSALLIVFECTATVLPAVKPMARELPIASSALCVSNGSVLSTAPGVGKQTAGGSPNSVTGASLIKDAPLLSLSSLASHRRRKSPQDHRRKDVVLCTASRRQTSRRSADPCQRERSAHPTDWNNLDAY